ncbi:unnamed protein product [Cyprideis torosa]|uniref:Uncharacterized protein n=1 Tax=Cyprideis torosa TaxID=163714 RepID=A0A7R8WBZ7_9CRUS|nr:unnamed protein product [Cyprideis torosa]CAG0892630.1 unnamed protein product [Cyprideis torosa]
MMCGIYKEPLKALNFANTTECGIYSDGDAERDSRIVGGVDARPGSFPYLVSIKYKPKNKHICGGTLISENFVLTAAHCLSYLNKTSEQLVVAGKNKFAVEVGEYSLKKDEPWSETKLVEEMILHPDYNHRSFQHDIALLKLSTPVEFKANWTEVGPACVCDPGEVTGDVTIAGWGRLEQVANTKECGIYSDGDAERDSRIVGGVDARPGSFPYLVSIKYKPKNKHICGGSLISENFVLTAAHCLSYLNKTSEQLVVAGKNQFAVEVGEYSLKEDEPWSETKLVEEIILHPDYNHRSFQHDIALLKLSTPVEFKANWTEVGPACVCNPGEVTGDVTIAGWGRLEQDGNPPDIIQTASIPIVQHGRCKRMMRLKGLRVSNTEICAGEKGRSVCKKVSDIVVRCAVHCLLFSVANTTDCGIQPDFNRNIRIVGGADARPGDFPYLVSITYTPLERHICGGTLISENYVLTAAHCLTFVDENAELEVVVGEHHLDEEEPWSEIKQVEQIIVHPDYNEKTFQHDIGLLKLSTPVEFGLNRTEIGVACLCEPDTPETGDMIVAGWGRLEEFANTTDCGIQPDFNRNIRIVGGADARPGDFPYLVSITYTPLERHICGGTLISENYVLTAAHCLTFVDENAELEVVVGEHHLDEEEPWSEIKQVEQIIVHPDYNEKTFQHDIGLLKLSTPVEFGLNRTE